jgi:glutamyl endopeptidase
MANGRQSGPPGGAATGAGRKADAANGVLKLKPRPDEPTSPLAYEPRANGVLPSKRLNLGRMTETNGGSCLENVPGFDARRARTLGLLGPPLIPPARRSRARDAAAPVLQKSADAAPVPVAVPDTTAVPWRCIAMLSITYEDGARATGTAWFLGERALATAGHNIRHPDHGNCTEILVAPGYDGREAPFATYPVIETHCDVGWLAGDENASLDYGALVLEKSVAGRRLGWFGLAVYDDGDLDKMILNLSGYPTDRRVATQYFTGGRLLGTDASFLHYNFDTSAGMSGAPVFALFDQQRVAVGIHTSAGSRFNQARRIDSGLYDFLSRFTAI